MEVNRLLEAGISWVYLTTHDRLRLHLLFAAEDEDLVAHVEAATAGEISLVESWKVWGPSPGLHCQLRRDRRHRDLEPRELVCEASEPHRSPDEVARRV